MTRLEFIGKAVLAAREARDEGAPIVPEIVAAQAALESGYGRSQLVVEANNLFGIKAGRSWQGPVLSLPTHEFDDEKGWYTVVARWRRYATWAECFTDYGCILDRLPWYRDAVAAARRNDPVAFLDGLQTPGEASWATDPRYKEKVLAVARAHGLVA